MPKSPLTQLIEARTALGENFNSAISAIEFAESRKPKPEPEQMTALVEALMEFRVGTSQPVPVAPAPAKKHGRPPGSKNKPKAANSVLIVDELPPLADVKIGDQVYVHVKDRGDVLYSATANGWAEEK